MKNLPIYLLGMVLTLYIMVMYVEPVFMVIFFAQSLLLVLSMVLALILRKSIRVDLSAAGNVSEAKQMIPVVFNIHNSCVFPANPVYVRMKYRNRMGGEIKTQWLCLYGDGRTDTRIELNLESEFCGMLEITADKIRVCDYLKLFCIPRKINLSLEIPVFPQIEKLSFEITPGIRDFIGESDVYSKERSGDDPSEVFDIRSYRAGDRMQQIHWKLTARSDEYMVKEFSRPLGYPVVVFLDFSKKAVGAKDLLRCMSRVIEAGLSISAALIDVQCRHYLAWCSEDMVITRWEIESVEDVYGQMAALLSARPHENIYDCMDYYAGFFGKDSFYTFLTLNLDLKILKDGEFYEEIQLDSHSFSGKNFIL